MLLFFDHLYRKDWTPLRINCITIEGRSETVAQV
jgi:hypothetical protein